MSAPFLRAGGGVRPHGSQSYSARQSTLAKHRTHSHSSNLRIRAAKREVTRRAGSDSTTTSPLPAQQRTAGPGWLGFLPFWNSSGSQQPADAPNSAELLADTVERVQEEEQAVPSVSSQQAATPDIGLYLQQAGLAETRLARWLSMLSAQTYFMSKITERSVQRKLGLKLVTTSLQCCGPIPEPLQTATQAIEQADAMAISPRLAAEQQEEAVGSDANAMPAMQALMRLDDKETGKQDKENVSPRDAVGASLSAAFQAAADAAANLTRPLTTNFSSLTSAAVASMPVQVMATQLQGAAMAGHSTALASLAMVSAAVESAWPKDNGLERAARAKATSPTQWYVADDSARHTRYFILQGSETMDHWRVNLTFDPVMFEDPSLGVSVHRGIYAAAQALYDRFLPMVQEHLSSSPYAKIVFTGHSLGGSLSTLLMLMYLRRGVIPAVALAPVYTFGSPAIFCDADAAVSPSCEDRSEAISNGLLSKLGLGHGAVRNVIMHRDIVPRAFACDYTLVADLLARVSESFRNHACLHAPDRKIMYFFLGKMLVLQPDASLRFVREHEANHPLLPEGGGLYTLRSPGAPSSHVRRFVRTLSWEMAQQRLTSLGNLAGETLEAAVSNIQPAAGLLGGRRRKEGDGKVSRRDKVAPVKSLTDAVMALMNFPHPLDILGNVASYGHDGAISRFHNPDNYSRALAAVLRGRQAGGPSSLGRLGEGAGSAIRMGMELLGQDDHSAFPTPGLDWHGGVAELGNKLTPGPNVFTGLGVLSTATIAANLWN